MRNNVILQGDALNLLKEMPDESVDMCLTSPPYFGLRNYDCDGQIGLEETPDVYIDRLVKVFHEVKRVLKNDGTLWLNMGDTYNGTKRGNTEIYKNQRAVTESFVKKKWDGAKPKDLLGIPWMLAFALRADGWYLRQDIVWAKNNAMPDGAKDRCTRAHEYIFLLSKSPRYYFDHQSIKEVALTKSKAHGSKDGRKNKRDVWNINTQPFRGAHLATFPQELARNCILAGCPESGVVLDPFIGAGTTAVVATQNKRQYIGFEINADYIKLANDRISQWSHS